MFCMSEFKKKVKKGEIISNSFDGFTTLYIISSDLKWQLLIRLSASSVLYYEEHRALNSCWQRLTS